MSETNQTKIQELQHGALITTIPRALAGALGWEKGTIVVWKLDNNGKLYIEKLKPQEETNDKHKQK